MDTKAILEKHRALRGQYCRLTWERVVKLRKSAENQGHVAIKRSVATVRVGLAYDNMNKTKEGRATGELPPENAGLPWGEWLEYPHVIGHKGETYLRFYPVQPGESIKVETTYSLDGKLVKADQIKPLALASEFRKSDPPLCFTLKADNVVSIE